MSEPRILIVEDDTVARAALQMILQLHGASVRAEADVAGGMAALAEKYDVIAADVMLPGDREGGLELVREAVRRNAAPVLVVMTGSNDPVLLDAARELCDGRLLLKPLDPPALLRAMGM